MTPFAISLPIKPVCCTPSVSVGPGATVFTRMFLGPSAFARDFVSASSAALVAAYNLPFGDGLMLAPELILTMLPPLGGKYFSTS